MLRGAPSGRKMEEGRALKENRSRTHRRPRSADSGPLRGLRTPLDDERREGGVRQQRKGALCDLQLENLLSI